MKKQIRKLKIALKIEEGVYKSCKSQIPDNLEYIRNLRKDLKEAKKAIIEIKKRIKEAESE